MSQPILSDQIIHTEKHKYAGLDHLRALAIVIVFIFHYKYFGHPTWLGQVTNFGWTGVDLFFVLSGFLIAGQLFGTLAKGKAISLKEFFIKRFFRIIPAYLVIVLLYAFFPVLWERGEFSPVWRYLTFTLNFGLEWKRYGTFTHAWSLCVEEHFYLTLPLIIALYTYFKLKKRAAIALIVLLFISGFVTRYLAWHQFVEANLRSPDLLGIWNQYVYYPTYNHLDGLLTGVSIAGLFTFYPEVKNRLARYGNILLLTGIALLILAFYLCIVKTGYYPSLFGFPLISVAYGFIVAAAVCPSCILYQVRSRITAGLATLSYSIYLCHKMLAHVTHLVLEKAGMDKDGNLIFFCCFIAAVLGALLLRYLIEKPFLKIRDKLLVSSKIN